MALWLNRAGRHGEFEKKFLDDNRIYALWQDLEIDLSAAKDKPALRALLASAYADAPKGRISQNLGQLWQFVHEMTIGDWVVLPSKMEAAIHIGEITGPYQFEEKAKELFCHSRRVKWLGTNIPRAGFDKDLLYSFSALSTICQIKRNRAEERVRAMQRTGWKRGINPPIIDPDSLRIDLEQAARDRIGTLLLQRFKGHGMARLVEAVLKAQGYTTFRSPEGPDRGLDILAAPGPLGFGHPRIAVQVKSGDQPIDRQTQDQLIGAMQKVQATQGLLVSWSGFKSSVDRETATEFFRVRLWDQKILIDQLLEHYERLDEDIRAELPLKRIWTLADVESAEVEADEA